MAPTHEAQAAANNALGHAEQEFADIACARVVHSNLAEIRLCLESSEDGLSAASLLGTIEHFMAIAVHEGATIGTQAHRPPRWNFHKRG
ncbi:hypothetical protein HN937_16965 [Candidatus Poribacteria bacterium]|jgi:hypothetical protein|nr:hypothetical protein [Candidatus Poribacteria bacterium]